MIRPATLALLLLLACTACKKTATPSYTLTANATGDTTWTTTDVAIENDKNIVYINATNVILNKRITLILNNYEAGNHTFNIGNAGKVNTTFSQSGAEYMSGAMETDAESGQIVITGSTTNTIEGTFDFEGSGMHVTGTFTAPQP